MNWAPLLGFLALGGCAHHSPVAAAVASVPIVNKHPVIHVIVALCDKASQGIQPVPKKIGNGDDPGSNLYWGCDMGVKSYFKRSRDWKLVSDIKAPGEPILETLVFHHYSGAWLVADAYRGRQIKQATADLQQFCLGRGARAVTVGKEKLEVGGSADFLVYVGHDGLMDFRLLIDTKPSEKKVPDVAVLCCRSKRYFTPILGHAKPVLLTNDLMAPEAYVVEAAVSGWLKKESQAQIAERAAVAYNTFQHCGMKGARNLFRP